MGLAVLSEEKKLHALMTPISGSIPITKPTMDMHWTLYSARTPVPVAAFF
jgi:hypothetical protein